MTCAVGVTVIAVVTQLLVSVFATFIVLDAFVALTNAIVPALRLALFVSLVAVSAVTHYLKVVLRRAPTTALLVALWLVVVLPILALVAEAVILIEVVVDTIVEEMALAIALDKIVRGAAVVPKARMFTVFIAVSAVVTITHLVVVVAIALALAHKLTSRVEVVVAVVPGVRARVTPRHAANGGVHVQSERNPC
jgi:hypothetical protein